MIRDTLVEDNFYDELREKNNKERELHISSGKLSASILSDPLQWQILKVIGVPPKESDDYFLGFLERGNEIEQTALTALDDFIVERQKEVTYRDVIGYVDGIIDTTKTSRFGKKFSFQCGIIPQEFKSVKNSKFRRLQAQKEPDEAHILQGSLYAMALNTKYFLLTYGAADDYRFLSWFIEKDYYVPKIDKIITDFQEAMKLGLVPIFTPTYKWQNQPDYCKYPLFMNLTTTEINDKLKKEFPDSYKILKEYKAK